MSEKGVKPQEGFPELSLSQLIYGILKEKHGLAPDSLNPSFRTQVQKLDAALSKEWKQTFVQNRNAVLEYDENLAHLAQLAGAPFKDPDYPGQDFSDPHSGAELIGERILSAPAFESNVLRLFASDEACEHAEDLLMNLLEAVYGKNVMQRWMEDGIEDLKNFLTISGRVAAGGPELFLDFETKARKIFSEILLSPKWLDLYDKSDDAFINAPGVQQALKRIAGSILWLSGWNGPEGLSENDDRGENLTQIIREDLHRTLAQAFPKFILSQP